MAGFGGDLKPKPPEIDSTRRLNPGDGIGHARLAVTIVRCVKSTRTLRLSSGSFQRFEESQRLQLQFKAAFPLRFKHCDTPKRPTSIHQLTQRNIPEDLNLQKHSCKNLRYLRN